MEKKWYQTQYSYIWVFAVGRGLSIFIRTGLNHGIIYDLGASDDFSPTEFLQKNIIPSITKYKKCKIAQAVISHPHLDHISEIEKLKENPFSPTLLTCPHDKEKENYPDEKIDWKRINNQSNAEDKIKIYKDLYSRRLLPLQTIEYDLVIIFLI